MEPELSEYLLNQASNLSSDDKYFMIVIVTSIKFKKIFLMEKLKKMKHFAQVDILAHLNNSNLAMLLFECIFNKNYG